MAEGKIRLLRALGAGLVVGTGTWIATNKLGVPYWGRALIAGGVAGAAGAGFARSMPNLALGAALGAGLVGVINGGAEVQERMLSSGTTTPQQLPAPGTSGGSTAQLGAGTGTTGTSTSTTTTTTAGATTGKG